MVKTLNSLLGKCFCLLISRVARRIIEFAIFQARGAILLWHRNCTTYYIRLSKKLFADLVVSLG